MKQIAPKLFIGSQADFDQLNSPFLTEWAVLLSAKDPWHRQFVGYKTAGAPEGPERLWARRGKQLALNLIDGPDAKYVTKSMIDAGLAFIEEQLALLKDDQPEAVLIACNKGNSRAPTLGLLYLAPEMPESFEEAEVFYKTNHYPDYAPANGIREFARIHWRSYRNRKSAQKPGNSAETDAALDTAQELWCRFATTFASDPSMARDNLIEGIRTALLRFENPEGNSVRTQ